MKVERVSRGLRDNHTSSVGFNRPAALDTSPLVTIICPIYNDSDLVSDSINSVLQQTMTDFRLILFDNGSLDDTRKVISKFTDDRISIVSSHFNLKSEIMATLLLDVDTPYVAQIYSDDVWEPKKLSLSLDELIRTDCDAVFSNNSFIGDHGQVLQDSEVPISQFVGDITSMTVNEHLHRFIFKGNSLHPVSMVIKTQSYKDLGGVKPYLHSIGDMEFFARLLLQKNVSFIPDRLQRIRIKSEGRQNESAPSRASYMRILGERMRFYDLLNTPQFMSRMDSVFFPDLKKVVIEPNLKKWFLGHQIMKLGDPDCSLIGMQMIYSALDEHMIEIEKYVIATHGKSIGQYIEGLASNCFVVAADILCSISGQSTQEIVRLNAIILDQTDALRHSQEIIAQFENQALPTRIAQLELDYERATSDLGHQRFENERLARTVEELTAAAPEKTLVVPVYSQSRSSYAEEASQAAQRMIHAGRWWVLPIKAIRVTFSRGPSAALKILHRLSGFSSASNDRV